MVFNTREGRIVMKITIDVDPQDLLSTAEGICIAETIMQQVVDTCKQYRDGHVQSYTVEVISNSSALDADLVAAKLGAAIRSLDEGLLFSVTRN
jgi:hypothetical protein